ncbi:MAG: trypsin-like peptidase domain-containing protein [Spirochaetales bacterium]|jgi:S1-C subfamily serine protease|nr:trypsin-like peptidase domain-containing protein [Spirochaetales bacterium]
MRLYSRRQVVFFTLVGTILIFSLALGCGFVRFPGGEENAAGTNASAESSGDADEKAADAARPDGFTLQTSPAQQGVISVDNGGKLTDDEAINIRVYETRNEGVVNITTEVLAYNWFLEPVPREGGTGSGSIIDTRGYVLTNNHVVAKAYKVFVTLADQSQVEGTVVGIDAENDLAVVKFDPGRRKLVTIPMGTSQGLRVGQKVLAIGNPFAFDRTLTTGIVSGLGRPIRTGSGLVMRDMIQTDASINPGNSGGPLLDSAGEMIGINTMIYSPSGGSVGIGFAVPVDTARRVVPELIKFGKVKRGWIDIIPVQLFPALVNHAKFPVSQGLLVSRLIAGGNAEKAGIRGGDRSDAVRYGNSIIYLGGDIIVEVDGMEIEGLSDLYTALEDNKPGETISVQAYRGSKLMSFTVSLSERPESVQWE